MGLGEHWVLGVGAWALGSAGAEAESTSVPRPNAYRPTPNTAPLFGGYLETFTARSADSGLDRDQRDTLAGAVGARRGGSVGCRRRHRSEGCDGADPRGELLAARPRQRLRGG